MPIIRDQILGVFGEPIIWDYEARGVDRWIWPEFYESSRPFWWIPPSAGDNTVVVEQIDVAHLLFAGYFNGDPVLGSDVPIVSPVTSEFMPDQYRNYDVDVDVTLYDADDGIFPLYGPLYERSGDFRNIVRVSIQMRWQPMANVRFEVGPLVSLVMRRVVRPSVVVATEVPFSVDDRTILGPGPAP